MVKALGNDEGTARRRPEPIGPTARRRRYLAVVSMEALVSIRAVSIALGAGAVSAVMPGLPVSVPAPAFPALPRRR